MQIVQHNVLDWQRFVLDNGTALFRIQSMCHYLKSFGRSIRTCKVVSRMWSKRPLVTVLSCRWCFHSIVVCEVGQKNFSENIKINCIILPTFTPQNFLIILYAHTTDTMPQTASFDAVMGYLHSIPISYETKKSVFQ